PALTARNPALPTELDRIVRKCLRKQPGERYQSTLDLVVDLRGLRQGTASRAPKVPVASVVDDDRDSLFQTVARRLRLSPRRRGEMHQLFAAFVVGPVTVDAALRSAVIISETLATAVTANWHGVGPAMQALTAADPETFWKNLGLPFYIVQTLLLVAAA